MKMKRFWGILLSLVLVLGLVPGMNLTAYADNTGILLTTITATGKEQASYSTANVATVSFSYTAYGSSAYSATWGWWGYGWSATVNAAEGYNITKCIFYDDANRTATDSSSPFVVETTEDDKTPLVNGSVINSSSKGIKKIDVYGYATPTHTHSFTYSASGATITATCTAEGCDLPPSTAGGSDHVATLTIAADGGTYDGTTDFSATITNNIPAVEGDTVGSIEYYKVDAEGATTGGTKQNSAPVDAGYYYASVTLTSGSNTYTAVKAFTVAKIDPTAPTGLTAPYGQKLSDVVLPTGWTWADSTQSVGNVVSPAATFKANFAGNDNYNAASNVDVAVTVSKADATTAMQAASVSIAGTSGKTATVSYTLPDGASYGAVTNSNTEFFTVDTTSGIVLTAAKNWTASDWATDTSKTFTVLVSGATNYNDYTLTVTVTPTYKATQTITAADVTATYGDTNAKIEATITSGGGTLSYRVKSGDAVTVNENTGALTIVKAGSAVITVTAAENDTYAAATKDVNVTVNTKAMTVSAENVNVYVDGQPHGITVNVTEPATGYTVKYGTEAGTYDQTTSPTQTEVGEKTVYYQVTADNYTTYTGSAKVTVSAKQTQTITAENVTAAYGDTGKSIEASTSGDGTLSYAVKSGDAVTVDRSSGALTILKAGSAVITVTAAETQTYAQATKDVNVTVKKADPIANAPTGLTAIYGQTLANVSLTDKNPTTNTPGSWAWADTTTDVGAVGDHTFPANFTPTDTTNYNSKTNVDVTVTVGKANNPATVTGTAAVMRGGNTVDLADNVTLNGATGDVSYTISGEANGCSLNGSVLTSGTDTGSVTVNVTVAADDNYNALAATPITVTISDKQTQTISADDVTVTYGDTDKSVNASVTDPATGGGAISYAVKTGSEDYIDVDVATGALTIKKAGTATVVVTAAEMQTYEQATKEVTVTVNKAANPASVQGTAAVMRGGNTVDLAENITLNGATGDISYTISGEANGCSLNGSVLTSGTDTGSVIVNVTVAADDNYNALAATPITVTISDKQPQTISADDVTVTYGDMGKSVSATTNGDGEISYAVKDGSGDYIDVDASTGALTIKKVGTAVVVVTAAETQTYEQATKEVTVTINKGEGGGNPSEKTLVYDGTAQELVTEGKAEGGTMMYALGENASTAPEETAFTASIPTGVDAKTYFVWYMVKGDANHNDTKPVCVEATIAKKGLTVTADAKSKTQGEADPVLTYTAVGLVGTDAITGALSREAGEDPGTYAITQGTLTAGDNYEITFTSAVLTINKKDEPAPVPSGGGSSGGGGYYGRGTVQNQRRDAYSDVIGAAATSFRDSSPERIRNIELACEKLDGIILQPGEVFSFNEVLGGLTAEAGFAVAPVNPDDEATAEIGGGVSQVASTLYTGSLFALLETVERTNHPFAVPFIQPGTDAYVTDPGNADALDLKFRNTRGEPIRISAKTKVDEARQVREIVIELQSALGSSDYMPIRFDNTWGGDQNAFLTATPYDLTRPGYRILLTHEEQAFTDNQGAGIRTLTHRKILDAAGMLVRDEILNSKLPDGSYAMDTYYQG